MKYDLARLMKENLNEINKMRKVSFVQLAIPIGVGAVDYLASAGASLYLIKILL